MKQSLMRPTAALFPAVLAIVYALGSVSVCRCFLLVYWIMQLLSLCPAESFRNAASREPGVRRLDKRFSGSFLQTAIGICLGTAASGYLFERWNGNLQMIYICVPVACIVIEQLFEERVFALNHPQDGVILSVVANLLLLAGLLLDCGGGVLAPIAFFYTICGAAAGMMIAIVAAYGIEPMHAFSLKPVNLGFFPRAAVQSLLYPLLAVGLSAFGIPAFGGWILWRLSRTVCRRSADESRKLNLLLMAVCAALVIASVFVEGLQPCAAACLLALLCAEAVFCAPGWRLYAGTALMIGAWILPSMQEPLNLIAVALALIAVGLNLHKAFLKKV